MLMPLGAVAVRGEPIAVDELQDAHLVEAALALAGTRTAATTSNRPAPMVISSLLVYRMVPFRPEPLVMVTT